ncbi:MAG: alkaline phosphatase family protein [Clostridia bacterium]|nr:alkaline phosphatase family protein [Clostridia bacterium]
MKFCLPDYQNCCLNVISSISGYLDHPIPHPTLPFLDGILAEKTYQNVIVMLFDGMGMDVIAHALPQDSFLRQHIPHVLSAVYPSTTTNATTCIECGLSPREAGWLGWTLYFPQIQKPVDIFINRSNGEVAADYNVAERYIPREMFFPKITAAGKADACCVSKFGDVKVNSVEELFDTVLSLARDEKRRYIYAYDGDPDHTMHEMGCYDEKVMNIVRDIDSRLQKLASELPEDTLLLATADHGLIDSDFHYLEEEAPEMLAMLQHDPSIETRAVSFHVKPECKADFPAAFKRHYGDHFLFMTGEEFIRDYLGDGETRPNVYDFVGDYMALSIDPWCLQAHRQDHCLKGVHAGLTELEMKVPLIVAKK